MTPEHEKARAWMESHGLTVDQLSELTGYSRAQVYWLLRGVMAPGQAGQNPREMNRYTWERFKNLCHAVDVRLRTGKTFHWEPAHGGERQ